MPTGVLKRKNPSTGNWESANTADAGETFQETAEKNAANGYPGLDSAGEVAFAQLPFDSGTYHKADEPAARVERTTNQTIPNSSRTRADWESAVFNNAGTSVWDSGSPDRLTLFEVGLWLVTVGAIWAVDNTGRREVYVIRSGGATIAEDRRSASTASTTSFAFLYAVSSPPVDVLVEVFQTSGADLDLLGNPRMSFAVQKVSES